MASNLDSDPIHGNADGIEAHGIVAFVATDAGNLRIPFEVVSA